MKKLLLILLCLPKIGFGQSSMVSGGLEAILLGLVVGGIMFILFYVLPNIMQKLRVVFKDSSEKKDAIKKLKSKLENIESLIKSFKEINETGKMSSEERKEWLSLTQDHKRITNQIKELKNADDNISNTAETQVVEQPSTKEKHKRSLNFDPKMMLISILFVSSFVLGFYI